MGESEQSIMDAHIVPGAVDLTAGQHFERLFRQRRLGADAGEARLRDMAGKVPLECLLIWVNPRKAWGCGNCHGRKSDCNFAWFRGQAEPVGPRANAYEIIQSP